MSVNLPWCNNLNRWDFFLKNALYVAWHTKKLWAFSDLVASISAALHETFVLSKYANSASQFLLYWMWIVCCIYKDFVPQPKTTGRRFCRPSVIRELKIETFSGRRQLQPDMTSWFVRYCACSCLPPCRRGPVGDVKLVGLALWRKREYLTFISLRFVAFSNQNFIVYRS